VTSVLDVPALVARMLGHKVYLDTNLFIYVLNDTPALAEPSLALLQACADRQLLGLTGDATLAELLVKPLQRNDAAAVAAVRALLIDDGAVQLLGHDRATFERAAQLRASHGLKMLDALHLATALQAGAACFISNDQRFPRLASIECLSLA
jgi:predicted nucleic acid-binding protein